jgi:inhibitor of KinA
MKSVAMHPLGDSAVLLQVDEFVSEHVHLRVKAITSAIEQHPFPGMIECVPAFTSVTVYYDLLALRKPDPAISSFRYVCSILENLIADLSAAEQQQPTVIEIPVCYGGELGPDLDYVAESNNLTPGEVIKQHTGQRYLIYAIGFAPGFPYLGGVPKSIATPRRTTPRISIPAGSVGIAGEQTGIYPIETPGGWQIIGRTPLTLFRPDRTPPSLLESGCYIQFRAVTEREFEQLKGVKA